VDLLGRSTLPADATIAVAIKAARGEQLHVGMAYRPDRGEPWRLLHLAWHHTLRDDELDDTYGCVLLAGLPALLAPAVVMSCKLTARQKLRNQLPYGFGWRDGALVQDAQGVLTLDAGVAGLTCATFVLAQLDLSGLRLVELETWAARPGDDAWKQWVIDMLRDHGASAEHVRQVQASTHHVRVRPDDVAGAASALPKPVAFAEATQAGALVRAALGLP